MQRFGFLLLFLLASQWRSVLSYFGTNESSSFYKSLEAFFGKAGSKSSDWLTVDPSKLLTTLADKGGLFIPENVDGDLRIMRRAVHCQESKLDPLRRNLILTNFTIGLKGKPSLLRIGRIFVHWDSYTDPVLSIQVSEVDVSIEFTNLLLTKTNWNELTAIGFPPEFKAMQSPNPIEPIKGDDYSWLRFEAIDVSGDVTVKMSSKPLGRDLGVMKLDMGHSLKAISEEVNKKSNLNYESKHRRGLDMIQLADLLQEVILQKAQSYVLEHFQHIDGISNEAIRGSVDKVIEKASNAITDYAIEATEMSANTIIEKLRNSKWGNRFDNLFASVNKTFTELSVDVEGDEKNPRDDKQDSEE
mmetsp:Transcript_7643/g.21263  ORF Transcript_7643/g.21263 Transcript_7643/m.21263 type:complete len:358 (+) Transcript_7643:69-1142(+)